MIKTYEAHIEATHIVAENTTEVVFRLTESMTFTAGQYMTVTLPWLTDVPLREQWHDFSIASSPDEVGVVRIVFRNSESSFKQALLSAPLGTRVIIEGPKGVFVLPEDEHARVVFVSGGIGITPFMSMLRMMHVRASSHPVALFYYNKNKESAACVDELVRMGDTYLSLSLHIIYGIMTDAEIHEYMKESLADNTQWYVAGPPGFVATARTVLHTEKITDDTIKTEEFSGYETIH